MQPEAEIPGVVSSHAEIGGQLLEIEFYHDRLIPSQTEFKSPFYKMKLCVCCLCAFISEHVIG